MISVGCKIKSDQDDSLNLVELNTLEDTRTFFSPVRLKYWFLELC